MIYTHFELEACRVTGASIKKIFTKTRKNEEVLARMLCMYFVSETTNTTLEKNANRYGLSHCAVLFCRKTIKNRSDTDPYFRDMIERYMDICTRTKQIEDDDLLGINVIRERGLDVFIMEQNSVFIRYMYVVEQFMQGKADDEEVLNTIREVEDSIFKIRHNFSK